MKFISLVAVTLATAALAGCFVSDPAFLTDANSVAPYESIVFREGGSDEPSRLERQGKAYVAVGADANVVLRFQPLDRPDWYVVQVSGDTRGSVVHLYALVKVDIPNGVAKTYAAVAGEETGPGLRGCEDHMVCLDSLDAYITHATAAVDAGAEPDSHYLIAVE